MITTKSVTLGVLLFSLLVFAHCTDPSQDPKPLDLGSCIKLNIIEESATFQGRGTFWGEGVYVQFTPNLKAPHTSDNYDRLVIKFRSKGYTQLPGTFDMGSEVNINHTTCEQCVEVIQDVSGDHIQVRNFQISGTITVDSINTATGESAGKIENAYFREIAETGYYAWGGYTDYDSCLYIEHARWNTFASNNLSCETYACPNQKLQSCNPYSGRCEPSPCGGTDTTCQNGGVCLPQEGHYRTGACYTLCEPFKECPPGYECIPISYDASRGILKKVGLKKEGEQCTGNVLSTDCEAGTNCASVNTYWSKQTKCFRHCDIFSDSNFCTDGRICAMYAYQQKETTNYCYGDRCFKNSKCLGPKDDMDTVAMFGEICSKAEGRPCNVEGSKATGLCVAVSKEDSQVRCFQLCRQNSNDCPPGKTCQEVTLYVNVGIQKIVLDRVGICK